MEESLNRILHHSLNLWVMLCVAGNMLMLMIVDELMMTLAYQSKSFDQASYLIPFFGSHGMWVVWALCFVVIFAINLVLAALVLILNRRT